MINRENIKVGHKLLSYDDDDKKWLKSEIKSINGSMITLVDVDERSNWQGLEWETDEVELQDKNLYKELWVGK